MGNKLKTLVVYTTGDGDCFIFRGEEAEKAESAIDYALDVDTQRTLPIDWEGGTVEFQTRYIAAVRREYEEVPK